MKCLHQFERTGTEDLGDRVLTKLSCTKCPKKRTVNRKKPRYVVQDTPRKSKVKRVPKLSKTLQNPRKRQRKAIPAMSEDKKMWDRLYKAKAGLDPEVVQGYNLRWEGVDVPVITRIHGPKGVFERHHVGRRWRWLLLWYRYVTPALHTWIEANSKKARELGLLFNVVRGELRSPSYHDPLDCLTEFEELKKQYT
jgi:hypothetical protein